MFWSILYMCVSRHIIVYIIVYTHYLLFINIIIFKNIIWFNYHNELKFWENKRGKRNQKF